MPSTHPRRRLYALAASVLVLPAALASLSRDERQVTEPSLQRCFETGTEGTCVGPSRQARPHTQRQRRSHMASVKARGVSAKQALLMLPLGAWVVFGAWGLVLFLTGEELGILDKLILLVWVAHMGSLVTGRRTFQQQSRSATSGESGRERRARAFGLILAAGFALALLSCVLLALGTLV